LEISSEFDEIFGKWRNLWSKLGDIYIYYTIPKNPENTPFSTKIGVWIDHTHKIFGNNFRI